MSTRGFTPICPRCGYDQSGIVDTWTDSCPTEGVCAECGLGFEWATVFAPARFDLPWYVEHGRGVRAWIVRSLKTIVRLLRPIRFWRGLDITKRVAPWALVRWALILVVVLHLINAVPIGIEATSQGRWRNGISTRSLVTQHGVQAVTTIGINGLADPFGRAWVRTPYRRPNAPPLIQYFPNRAFGIYEQVVRLFSFPIGFACLWAVVLGVVPSTRKLAKVRAAHLVRAVVLACVMIVVTFEVHRLVSVYQTNASVLGYGALRITRAVLVYGLVVWQLVYWPSVVIVGWRIEQRRLLLTLGTIAAILGGVTLWVLLYLVISDASFR